MMTELVRKAELATERLAAQLAARGSGGAAALSACSPAVPPAVGDLIHAVRSSAHVRASAQGLAGAGSSCGAPPEVQGFVSARTCSFARYSTPAMNVKRFDQWCVYNRSAANPKPLPTVDVPSRPAYLCK